jgi:hypothetical protein
MTGRAFLIALASVVVAGCMTEGSMSEDEASAYFSIRSYQTRPFLYATQSIVRGEADVTADLFDAPPVVSTHGRSSVTAFHPASVDAEAVRHFTDLTVLTADRMMRRLDIDSAVEVEIFVVPEGYRAGRRVHYVRLPNQTVRLRFYMRDISVLNSPVGWSQSISHELYHVVRGTWGYHWSGWDRVIEETSADFLPVCAQLDEVGFANWQTGANGSFTDEGRIERTFGPLNDELLRRWIDLFDAKVDESRDQAAVIVGAMNIWAEISHGSWQIEAGTESADRLNAICEMIVDDRSDLPDLLREMADDGVDAPTMPRRPREPVFAPYAVPIEQD